MPFLRYYKINYCLPRLKLLTKNCMCIIFSISIINHIFVRHHNIYIIERSTYEIVLKQFLIHNLIWCLFFKNIKVRHISMILLVV